MRPLKVSSLVLMLALSVAPAMAADGAGGADKAAASTQPAFRPPAAPTVYTAWPFDAKEAAERQEETARALRFPKEMALDLGNRVTMKLALIPAGRFVMGSPKDEKDRYRDEGPQRDVTISKPFYLGVCEVTQEQWAVVMGVAPWTGKEHATDGATHAASYISWNDAAEFCKKLSAKTGRTVSLPTKAQWEYACRAGGKARYGHGNDDEGLQLGDYAWYDRNAWNAGEPYAHAVGRKKPNAWGLYDMHGNVWEWCADGYADSYASAGKADPAAPASGRFRLLRGGSFLDGAGYCRSSFRGINEPARAWRNVGLRIVCDGPAKSPEERKLDAAMEEMMRTAP